MRKGDKRDGLTDGQKDVLTDDDPITITLVPWASQAGVIIIINDHASSFSPKK